MQHDAIKTALYKNQPVSFSTYPREKWHALYLASKKDAVSCLHCGAPLDMRFPIHEAPTFVHPDSDMRCAEEIAAYERIQAAKEETAATTIGSFSLPQRRAILTNPTPSKWRSPTAMTKMSDFRPPITEQSVASHRYRNILAEKNIIVDNNQWRAIQHVHGPLCLLAGAGSGKTRVLTSRAAYMIACADISPKEMVLITFTAKAAQEMRVRMRTYPGVDPKSVQTLVIRTFHSLFYTMLQHAAPNQWQPAKLLQPEWQRVQLLKEVGNELGLTDDSFAFDQALTQISYWKNHLLAPNEVEPSDIFEERCRHLYERYEQTRITAQRFDFDDMLIGCLHLLQDNESLLQRYQQRFAYIAIDEFQDINKIQFDIIQLLAQPTHNLCVVGDDDQSIYAFRGSDPNYIQSFQDIYQEATTIYLTENYRSSHPIISCANEVIAKNRRRTKKTLTAQYTTDISPHLFYPYNEEEEATMITEDIQQTLNDGVSPLEIAIIYRTNVAARAIIERLMSTGIPFTIEQDFSSFYERNMVRCALAFLRIGQDEENITVLSDLLQALFLKRTTISDIHLLQTTHQCSSLEALSFLENLPTFQQKRLQTLPEQCRSLQALTPTAALNKVEHTLDFKDTLKKQGHEGHKMDKGSDDFRQLQVIAAQFDTVPEFLSYIEQMTSMHREKQQLNTHIDGVHLLTIHRAKGLEFDHVYILGAVENSLPHEYALDALRGRDEAPLEEERRLMYVAMTRAKTHLTISVPTYYRKKRVYPSRFLRTFTGRRQ
ncbi:ATP-dependent helicase [Bacillus sp. FSL W7-1360]